MAKTAKVAKNPAVDPTMPKVELKLDGNTYHLCFTFASLALAEAELKRAGQPVNIFQAFDFDNLDAAKTVALLYGALVAGYPEVTLAEIPALITLRQIPAIKQALFDAFALSMAEPSGDAKPDPLAAE